MIINGIKLNDVKVDKSEKTELSERDNKIIGWVSLALATLLLIAFFLGGFFSPVKASAGELVGDSSVESVFDNYIIFRELDGHYIVHVDIQPVSYKDGIFHYRSRSYYGVLSTLDEVKEVLATGYGYKDGFGSYTSYSNGLDRLLYSSIDLKNPDTGEVFFTQTPYVTGHPTVGGLQAPEIATALTSQMVGLVPLVLGLLVLAICLWKGLSHLRQMLSRA